MIRHMFLLAASCAAVACASEPSWEHDFHQEIVNQSTQADVRTKFGEPEMVTPLNNGGSVWTYRYSRGTFKSGYAATSECREYGLTFDKAKVLRSAKELDCSGTLKGYDPTEDEKFLKEPGGR